MKPSSIPSTLFGLTLILAAPAFLTSCDGKAKQAVLVAEEEVASLQQANSRLQKDVELLRQEGEKRQNELLKRNEELQKEADEVKAQFEKLEDEAVKARKELDDYMAKYKLGYRAKLKGQSLPSLQMKDATNFQAVVLREVTPTEVAFSHSSGVSRVPMEKLTPEMQRKFLYDPLEAQRQEEAKVAAAVAGEGLGEVDGEVVQKDPNRAVNPVVVHNLRTRIQTRQKEIQKAMSEAQQVKQSGFNSTNIGQYRIQVLGDRAKRLREEIKTLVAMLNKELNG